MAQFPAGSRAQAGPAPQPLPALAPAQAHTHARALRGPTCSVRPPRPASASRGHAPSAHTAPATPPVGWPSATRPAPRSPGPPTRGKAPTRSPFPQPLTRTPLLSLTGAWTPPVRPSLHPHSASLSARPGPRVGPIPFLPSCARPPELTAVILASPRGNPLPRSPAPPLLNHLATPLHPISPHNCRANPSSRLHAAPPGAEYRAATGKSTCLLESSPPAYTGLP